MLKGAGWKCKHGNKIPSLKDSSKHWQMTYGLLQTVLDKCTFMGECEIVGKDLHAV